MQHTTNITHDRAAIVAAWMDTSRGTLMVVPLSAAAERIVESVCPTHRALGAHFAERDQHQPILDAFRAAGLAVRINNRLMRL